MTVLVTGARGAIARNVIAQLLESGTPVRAASRVPGATALPAGGKGGTVEPVRVDFTAPETLAPALEGVEQVFLYAAHEGLDEFLTAAKEAGVKHLVLLSSAAVTMDTVPDNPILSLHSGAERLIEASGLPWTFVRPGMFATNSLWWADSIRNEGVVRLPYPDAPVNPIHERDIAEAAYTTLVEGGHEGRTYVIDGPGHLSQRRQVELIGEAIGREIAVEELPREVAAKFMPEPVLDMLAAGSTKIWGPTSEAVTGRPARTYADWTVDHAADFR